jgi:hypothetical protein
MMSLLKILLIMIQSKHISLTDAHKIEPDFEIGEEVTEPSKIR